MKDEQIEQLIAVMKGINEQLSIAYKSQRKDSEQIKEMLNEIAYKINSKK